MLIDCDVIKWHMSKSTWIDFESEFLRPVLLGRLFSSYPNLALTQTQFSGHGWMTSHYLYIAQTADLVYTQQSICNALGKCVLAFSNHALLCFFVETAKWIALFVEHYFQMKFPSHTVIGCAEWFQGCSRLCQRGQCPHTQTQFDLNTQKTYKLFIPTMSCRKSWPMPAEPPSY